MAGTGMQIVRDIKHWNSEQIEECADMIYNSPPKKLAQDTLDEYIKLHHLTTEEDELMLVMLVALNLYKGLKWRDGK